MNFRLGVRRGALALSLLSNVILFGLLARPVRHELASETSAPIPPTTAANQVVVTADGGSVGYYETLLSRGLSDADAKALLLARLEGEARSRAGASGSKYWKSAPTAGVQARLHLLDELGRVRQALIGLFGNEAETDPTLAKMFRPLDPEFYFLTSVQQVEIQRLKLQQQEASIEAAQNARSPGNCQIRPQTPVPAGRPPEQTSFVAELARVLEEPTLSEYLLRDSSVAAQLRASRVEFTEPRHDHMATGRSPDRLYVPVSRLHMPVPLREWDLSRANLALQSYCQFWCTSI